jgi:hypothetical protein
LKLIFWALLESSLISSTPSIRMTLEAAVECLSFHIISGFGLNSCSIFTKPVGNCSTSNI